MKIRPTQTLASAIPTLRQREVELLLEGRCEHRGLSSTAEYAVAPAVPAARTAQR